MFRNVTIATKEAKTAHNLVIRASIPAMLSANKKDKEIRWLSDCLYYVTDETCKLDVTGDNEKLKKTDELQLCVSSQTWKMFFLKPIWN